ncbi:hypothetical protein JL39_22225 [Rhizobium sp. YS-1r]|nr:hypothetical protein JL39_22225 [Rhizobium sp. YS-1r]
MACSDWAGTKPPLKATPRSAVVLRTSLDRAVSSRRGLLKQERRGVRWQAAPAMTLRRKCRQPQPIAE